MHQPIAESVVWQVGFYKCILEQRVTIAQNGRRGEQSAPVGSSSLSSSQFCCQQQNCYDDHAINYAASCLVFVCQLPCALKVRRTTLTTKT